MAFEDMDTKHRAKEGGGRKEHKHANRTLVKGSERRGRLPAGGWSHGGLTVLGYLSVCTQSCPLSSPKVPSGEVGSSSGGHFQEPVPGGLCSL